jgi:potassium-transporting ATPase potassium-binding subunit
MNLMTMAAVLLGAAALSFPLGRWMAAVFEAPSPSAAGATGPRARILRAVGGRAVGKDQSAGGYIRSLLVFNVVLFALVVLILALQAVLPGNPDHKGRLSFHLILHIASTFVTNTNLQHYSGEVALSPAAQIYGLMVLQFLSAATGLAALAALARGLSGRVKVGNFLRDVVSAALFVLLPLSLVGGAVLVLGGVPMTWGGAVTARTLEGGIQTISRGPVAAFEAIKQIGSNGGGYFGPNSAHPFENPTRLTNIVEMLAMLILPLACVWMFGRMTRKRRHAAVVFGVMAALLLMSVVFCLGLETRPSPAFRDPAAAPASLNWEGQELRFGSAAGPFWSALTTSLGNGSVNGMLDSHHPATVLMLLVGMWTNVAFGGVGVGFINLFLYIVIGVFICGLMVGRTPEYMSRKIETPEMKLALFGLLVHPVLILGGTVLFAAIPRLAGFAPPLGAHGFSRILYEFTSASANNGSGLEGLPDGTAAWNLASAAVMILGRYLPIILPLLIGGRLAAKAPTPETAGSFRIDTPLFGLILLGTVLLVGALLFMPVAVLGPVTEILAGPGK